jgi:uncharacterized membrane protein SirB2
MLYLLLKTLHVGAAILSVVGFAIRGYLKIIGSARLQQRWMRITPHIVDTVLLVSAIVLAVVIAASPFEQLWLAVKIIALVVYILLGVVVMRLARNNKQRVIAYVGALAVFAYIVTVAVSKHL